MPYDPDRHHRSSIRLKEFDYSSAGAYFVTICVQGRECLLGEIRDEKMGLNDAGRMVDQWLLKLPEQFPHVALDEYVIMPNHFHGIILLNHCDDDIGRRGEPCVRPDIRPNGTHANSLGRVVQAFKSLTTVEYIRGAKEHIWPPFHGRLWQRNYYERVIRNDAEMSAIREYICFNPSKWALDKENPQCA